ncbi:hypothetical protein ABIC01_008913 [Bradyrhizobium sp. RT4b]
MRCLTLTLMLSFVGLSLSNCTPEQIDSFCQVYNQVIVQKGDGSISAPPAVKRRLLANELLYRQQCTKK